MARKQKEEYVPPILSEWEQDWTKDDYLRHESDFQRMRVEYHKIYHDTQEDAVLTKWRLFEKDGAVRIDYDEGEIEGSSGKKFKKYTIVVTNPEAYKMASAKIEKFEYWMMVKAKMSMSPEEYSKKVSGLIAEMKKMTLKSATETERPQTAPNAPQVTEEKKEPPVIEEKKEEQVAAQVSEQVIPGPVEVLEEGEINF